MADYKQYVHTIKSDNHSPNEKTAFQSYLTTQESQTKRYYSSSDVEIYFGELFIDEAKAIQYALDESTLLLFGYNSYVFDGVAKGSRMVQGMFAINFIEPDYLLKMLSKLSEMKGTGAILPSRFHAVWPMGFDLYVSLGEDTSLMKSRLVKIEEVHITQVRVETDARTGEPIGEVYTFVAKDLIPNASYPDDEFITSSDEFEENTSEEVVSPGVTPAITHGSYDKPTRTITMRFSSEMLLSKIQYSLGSTTIFKNITPPTKPTNEIKFTISEEEAKEILKLEYAPLTLSMDFTIDEATYKETYKFSLKIGERDQIQ